MDSDLNDNLWLRPLGQKDILADQVRSLLSKFDEEISNGDKSYEDALSALTKIPADLRTVPFRDLLLINPDQSNTDSTWTISAGGRAKGHSDRIAAAIAVCDFLLNDQDISNRKLDALRQSTTPHLVVESRAQKAEWWDELMEIKNGT